MVISRNQLPIFTKVLPIPIHIHIEKKVLQYSSDTEISIGNIVNTILQY